MLSRVANSLYWMARYTERAENIARLINVNLNLSLDLPRGEREQWEPLVSISGDRPMFDGRYDTAHRRSVTQFLTFDPDNGNSILASLRAARENARSIREAISSEMWEALNGAYIEVRDASAPAAAEDDPHEFFTRVRQACQLTEGVTDATMTHNEAWHWARLGRMVERADKTSRILDTKYYILLPSPDQVGSPLDAIQWAALLRSCGGFEMYRRKHGNLRPERVVDFLVLDRDFPRAMLFCLITARDALHAISGTPMGHFGNDAEQRLAQLHADLAYARVNEVVAAGLHEFLDATQRKLNTLDDAIFDTFFALRPVG